MPNHPASKRNRSNGTEKDLGPIIGGISGPAVKPPPASPVPHSPAPYSERPPSSSQRGVQSQLDQIEAEEQAERERRRRAQE